MFNRVIVIVLDSVGIGALPDAADYNVNDVDANTLVNIARSQGGLFLPCLEQLGLGLVEPIMGVKADVTPLASYGKMAEVSKGKDTTTGHWEMAGCPLEKPFPVFPEGFDHEFMESLVGAIGRPVLGGKPASGTQIISELGEEHLRTGYPIVYTSADSVLQIAAHEEIIPLPDLYKMCEISREEVCINKYAVGRVIARPFIGMPGSFVRTANRHDYSLKPPADTVLDKLFRSGLIVVGIGKITDIFASRGISKSYPTKSNVQGMQVLQSLLTDRAERGLIMANLVEFDSHFGHRNDTKGYAQALEDFDKLLADLLPVLNSDDLLIISADHGCDPTVAGTDHTREYVPLIVYNKGVKGKSLGIRTTFADVAATIAQNFSVHINFGTSFLNDIVKR